MRYVVIAVLILMAAAAYWLTRRDQPALATSRPSLHFFTDQTNERLAHFRLQLQYRTTRENRPLAGEQILDKVYAESDSFVADFFVPAGERQLLITQDPQGRRYALLLTNVRIEADRVLVDLQGFTTNFGHAHWTGRSGAERRVGHRGTDIIQPTVFLPGHAPAESTLSATAFGDVDAPVGKDVVVASGGSYSLSLIEITTIGKALQDNASLDVPLSAEAKAEIRKDFVPTTRRR